MSIGGKRFTNEELYELRSSLRIERVIESLKIPSKVSEGFLRFLCPSCHEFQTAVNPRTNLGRCFRCERNFNTIEIVMTERKARFVEAVHFLKERFFSSSGLAAPPASPLKVSVHSSIASDNR